jgi:hypothetical protein
MLPACASARPSDGSEISSGDATFDLKRSSHLAGYKHETEEEGANAPKRKISAPVPEGKYFKRLSQPKTNRLP